jgi:predicted acetyltransferase
MQVRNASHADIPAVAELWVHTFPGERGQAERMRDLETGGAFGGIESVEIAELDGELAGAMKLYRMAQFTGGARFPLMGLAAVGVAPWARRRGVAAGLCRHALRAARERGDVLSGLYPVRPDF